MLDKKVLLNQFSKWTLGDENLHQLPDFYKYLICGKSGIFATDGSRLVSTAYFRMNSYFFDKGGNSVNIELPKYLDLKKYETKEELIEDYCFNKHNKVIENEFSISEEISVELFELRRIKSTLKYISSMYSKGQFESVIFLKSSGGKLFLGALFDGLSSAKIKFDLNLKNDWEVICTIQYVIDLVDLLISTKTYDFKFSLTKDTTPEIVVESSEFIALICTRKSLIPNFSEKVWES